MLFAVSETNGSIGGVCSPGLETGRCHFSGSTTACAAMIVENGLLAGLMTTHESPFGTAGTLGGLIRLHPAPEEPYEADAATDDDGQQIGI